MAKKNTKVKKANKNDQRKSKQQRELETLKELNQEVEGFNTDDLKTLTKFTELPISETTIKGLKQAHYVDLRDIQRLSIVPALKGRDILGAAQTGSGKTLAFLIPMLEMLYRESWTDFDGLGVMILSPTRELAIQTYDVLTKIGKYHDFSAALVTGGKSYEEESQRLARVNILIGTPGRIVQHMHQSSQLDVSNVKMLILDEADRMLDEGFRKQVDSIVQDLPPRQTLLFSATQTKRVQDLTRLALKSPEYISPHGAETIGTPDTLQQFYIVCEDHEKLNNLFAFIKSHLKSKMMVFFSTIRQVSFVFDTFSKLQPGIPLMEFTGKKKLNSRLEVTEKFKAAKSACLFATDAVARGWDVPGVDWVIQVDMPNAVEDYVHRAGRAARNGKTGNSLLMLTSKEESDLTTALKLRKIPITRQNVRQGRKKDITKDLQKMCYDNPNLKALGQKILGSLALAVECRAKDLSTYKVEDIPFEKLAESLGLPGVPNMKRVEEIKKNRARKNMSRALLKLETPQDDQKDDEKKQRTKYDRMFERQNNDVLSSTYRQLQEDENDEQDDDEQDDDFLSVKGKGTHETLEAEELVQDNEPESKRAAKRALSKKQSAKEKSSGHKVVFDDEGKPHELYEFENEDDFKRAGDADTQKRQFIDRESEVMTSKDVEDKALAREKRQEKKRKRKEVERQYREAMMDGSESDVEVRLPSDNEQESEAGSSSDEEPEPKKRKWFQRDEKKKDSGVLEVEEPETLEDLEALSSKLIGRS